MSDSLLPIPFSGQIPLRVDRVAALPPGARLARHGRAGALVHGRLRFVDEPPGKVADDPAAALLQRWLASGDAVLDAVAGEFLLMLWNEERGTALLAVDRFSTYPLYWAAGGSTLGFSARPAQAAELAGLAAGIDWQAVIAYAYFHMIPAPSSIFDGVRRLDLGEALRIVDGRAEPFRYWSPVFDEQRPFDFATERKAFLAALDDGIAECTAGFEQREIGCFLSGGTDSSTIAGLVTRHFGAPARTFSIGFDVGGYDESWYARLAARHFGTEHTEHYVTADEVYAAIEAVATQYEQPFGNASALPTYLCAGIAREAGVRRMLGGDGGDELYGGNERYAKQAVFGYYERVPAVLRRGLLEPILFGPLRGIEGGIVAKGRSYVEQAKEPLPDRLQSRYNLLNRLGAANVFTDAVLAQVSLAQPLALEREVWSRARATSGAITQIDQLLAWDFKFTLADSDLPKVTRMCQAAGVEVAFPMLTRALVEHSLQLAPGQKLKGRTLRHFFKESLRGFLPDEIIAKRKHGFGLPFGDWVLRHEKLQALANDALRSLAARGVIRPEFLQTLLGQLASGHAGYYGTMVWVLTMLELWLRASPLADVRVER